MNTIIIIVSAFVLDLVCLVVFTGNYTMKLIFFAVAIVLALILAVIYNQKSCGGCKLK
ncbi:hypothetical protein KAJ41_01790 [Candidatus Parcubacteria bacterium]|nr:hypothetical protein [Candidatus Parcubacteria bacterium]